MNLLKCRPVYTLMNFIVCKLKNKFESFLVEVVMLYGIKLEIAKEDQ